MIINLMPNIQGINNPKLQKKKPCLVHSSAQSKNDTFEKTSSSKGVSFSSKYNTIDELRAKLTRMGVNWKYSQDEAKLIKKLEKAGSLPIDTHASEPSPPTYDSTSLDWIRFDPFP